MRTTGGVELSEAGTSCRNTLYMRPWLSRATSRTVLRCEAESPPRGTIVRSTTITPENGAPGTGVRKMPLVFWAEPCTDVARRIRRTSREKLVVADREHIGLRQQPADRVPPPRTIRKAGARFQKTQKLGILTKNWYFCQSSRLAAPGYIEVMDLTAVIQIIDEEIARLEQVRALLSGHTAPLKRGSPPSEASDLPRTRR